MIKTQSITENIIIQLKKNSPPPPDIEQQINEIWEIEKANRGCHLFNGEILSFICFKQGILEAQVSDYRTYLAQLRDPNLYKWLKIQALAVSGIITFESSIVFGKRAMHVTQAPGKWELVPSGSLTPGAIKNNGNLAIEEQFFEELYEELGLKRTMVASLHPFLLVEDTKTHVIDIGIDVKLSGNRYDISRALKQRSDEYSEITWIHERQVTELFSTEQLQDTIVEVSLELIKAKNMFRPT